MRSSVTGNRFHSFYPGMLVFQDNCSENLVSSNHFLRDHEPWPPMQAYDNGLDDLYGLLYISGNHNSIIANHISESIAARYIKPSGAVPVIIHVAAGQGNYISSNHIVASTEAPGRMAQEASGTQAGDLDSCFSAQVGALLTARELQELKVTAVLVEREAGRS